MYEVLHGIVELPSYIRLADKLLNAEERQDLIGYLAEHPKAERNELTGLVDVLVNIWKGRAK
ncbi:MAG: hypothetical protein WA983_11190 [Castellaniella sp.]|uniref:hypothetical protein n=1 Tax=Castellaniella sp. TaxID=1955812 RepID=UPI003C70F21B